MRKNPFTPLGDSELTGSERARSGSSPVPKDNSEKHDSRKAGIDGQLGEQRRGNSKNSPGR
jgi:hypothetical protein